MKIEILYDKHNECDNYMQIETRNKEAHIQSNLPVDHNSRTSPK